MSPTETSATESRARLLQELLGHYRRLCVLRRLGRGVEAHNLQVACVDPGLEQLRGAGDFDAADVEARFALEEQRVEDAALLAECLAPFLELGAAPAPSPREERRAPPAAETTPVSPRSRPSAGNVAAFIDDMLAQNPPRRR